MKRRIKISFKPPFIFYVPKQLVVEEGFGGDTFILSNAVTATIIKPGTLSKDIITSLKLIIEDIELRSSRGEEIFSENDEKESKGEEKKESNVATTIDTFNQ